MIADLLAALDTTSGQVTTIVGCLVLLGGLWMKFVHPRIKKTRAKLAAAGDAILGREARYDSITGELVQPELPGIGVRMFAQETGLATLANVVANLADSHERLDDHERRIRTLEDQTKPVVAHTEIHVAPQQ